MLFYSSSPNFCRRPVGPPVDRVPPSWEVDLEWRGWASFKRMGERWRNTMGYHIWERPGLEWESIFFGFGMIWNITVKCMSSSCFFLVDRCLQCRWLEIFLDRMDSLHIPKVCVNLSACPVTVLFNTQQTTKKMDLASEDLYIHRQYS